MDCRQSQKKLATLRPGEEVVGYLAAHVEECVRCRRLLEADQDVWRLLELHDSPPAPAHLLDGVEERLAARVQEKPRLPELIAWVSRGLRPGFRLAVANVMVVALGTGAGIWLGSTSMAPARGPVAVESSESTAQAYAQFFDVAPPGSITRAYFSLDPGENNR